MEFIKAEEIVSLTNTGVVSRQLLNPDNSDSERVTITEVHLESNACQPRHVHETSEQIWYAVKGCAKLLLADGAEKEIHVGDVVRFAEKETSKYYFYSWDISVTTPPIHFGYAYTDKK